MRIASVIVAAVIAGPVSVYADFDSCRSSLISELEEVANMDENNTGDTGYRCELTSENWNTNGQEGCETSVDFRVTCSNGLKSNSGDGGYCCP